MSDLQKLVENITATAELMGSQLSGQALAVMAEDLAGYAPKDVSRALQRVRRECQRFSLAAVISRLPGGWPGAEEAWAEFPKDEWQTGVVTQEALKAWGVAMPLWDGGDKIGARMAFKESYDRMVGESENKMPNWSVSLGFDKEGRADPIKKAVEQGRLPSQSVKKYLPELGDESVSLQQLVTKLEAISE